MRDLGDELRDQGRAVAGSLLVVGLALTYTMEVWHLGWRLPYGYLLAYGFGGLPVVFAVTRQVGFRTVQPDDADTEVLTLGREFAELVVQSFLTAYAVLLLFGVVDLDTSLSTVVRLGLILVVPFGLGAGLANRLLTDDEESVADERFPRNLPVYVLGALFVALPPAPTGEMEVLAVHAGWTRAPVVVVASLLVVYLILYELEFRGHEARIEDRSRVLQVGETFTVYALAVVISFLLLGVYGHFVGATVAEAALQTIVLAFPASVGASGGAVVL